MDANFIAICLYGIFKGPTCITNLYNSLVVMILHFWIFQNDGLCGFGIVTLYDVSIT